MGVQIYSDVTAVVSVVKPQLNTAELTEENSTIAQITPGQNEFSTASTSRTALTTADQWLKG